MRNFERVDESGRSEVELVVEAEAEGVEWWL